MSIWPFLPRTFLAPGWVVLRCLYWNSILSGADQVRVCATIPQQPPLFKARAPGLRACPWEQQQHSAQQLIYYGYWQQNWCGGPNHQHRRASLRPPIALLLLLITTLRLISGGIPTKYCRRTQRSKLADLVFHSLSPPHCELSSRKLGRKQREIAGCCPCNQGDNLICCSSSCSVL